MTLTAGQSTAFSPTNNPCAQCGKPIVSPSWSEPGEHCVTYVWVCQACDYEFVSTAVYRAHPEERSLAA